MEKVIAELNEIPSLTDDIITQGNQAIAKFMGYEYISNDKPNTGWWKIGKYKANKDALFSNLYDNTCNEDYIGCDNNLAYHKDWNKLVPVIHKCIELDERDTMYHYSLDYLFGNIENAWKIVCEFIKESIYEVEWWTNEVRRNTVEVHAYNEKQAQEVALSRDLWTDHQYKTFDSERKEITDCGIINIKKL